MQRSVFYSWQSNLPNSTNKEFIKNVIATSLTDIESDDAYLMIPFPDRGKPGSTALKGLTTSIFTKINNSRVFICDVSMINKPGVCGLAVPNPNVALELGYAASKFGWNNIIVLMNEAYGGVETLPFDLSASQFISYSLSESAAAQTDERQAVALKLKGELIEALIKLENRSDKSKAVNQDSQSDNPLEARAKAEREAKAELRALKNIISIAEQNKKTAEFVDFYMTQNRSDLAIKFALQLSSITVKNEQLIKITEFCIGSGDFASARKAIDDMTYLAQRGELAIKVLMAMDLSD